MLRVIDRIRFSRMDRLWVEVMDTTAQACLVPPAPLTSTSEILQLRSRMRGSRVATQRAGKHGRGDQSDHCGDFAIYRPRMQRLVFLHIPKTGGMTLRSLIRHNYPLDTVLEVERDQAATITPEQVANARAIVGHLDYGWHRQVGISADTITLLRHPLDRLVSLYFYIRRRGPSHPLTDLAAGSLASFAASEYFELHNDMTRQLSGLPGKPDRHALTLAKENLVSGIAEFGTDERFDESLLLFQRRFGWQSLYYRRENVTSDRPSLKSIDPAVRRMIERNNALDLELWEVANRELDARIETQPASFHAMLRTLRRRNKVYSALVAARRAMPSPLRQLLRHQAGFHRFVDRC
jgi:hypothetical protein